ncbi:puromycin-sensitive aminopeptidase [Podospora aff. communis PSN243]|uniref:Puromycin-sensitive aminopeptidase n=1 Tax=Podospora aff. communis PSN243 TaxID=3040156 RepID=A0AAV9GCA8_9PEZI|nr:puromycin-sensitive aminopeptidase [Podospora aff. communis PSN243]
MASAPSPDADPTAMVGLMPPPPGVTPDFYRTTPVQVSFIVVFAVTFTLATLALILRLYTRAWIVKSISLDEPLLFTAWGVTLAFFIESLKAMPAGFGRNLWDVTGLQLLGYLERLLTLALTYIWPPTLTKLSILVLYWRINPDKIFRGCIIATAVVLIGYTVVFTALFSGPCNPLLGTPESQVCLNNIAVSQAVLNIVTDGIIIALPIPTIHSLQMPFKQRLSVGFILALGSAACIASIVRVAYVRAMVDNPDFTFTQCSAAVWSLLEMNLGILCNSLATLKPFLRRHLPSLLSMSRTTANSGHGTPGGSYGKASKGTGSKIWGQSYKLGSVAGGSTSHGTRSKDEKDGVVVVNHQFSVDYDTRKGNGPHSVTTGKGDSTESILALQYPTTQGAQGV